MKSCRPLARFETPAACPRGSQPEADRACPGQKAARTWRPTRSTRTRADGTGCAVPSCDVLVSSDARKQGTHLGAVCPQQPDRVVWCVVTQDQRKAAASKSVAQISLAERRAARLVTVVVVLLDD